MGLYFFFFSSRRRHTRYIGDWSSDVCSSDLGLALAGLVLMGAASTSFTASTNSLLQLAALMPVRGRVMALWSVVYLGSTPVGGPIVGFVSEHAGPRAGLALGAVATLATGAGLLMAASRRKQAGEPVQVAQA